MSIDLEYAIKKDIRNNPVVREIDQQQRADFWRTVGVAAAIVLMLLFSAWQRFRVLDGGYEVSKLKGQREEAARTNRLLRLQLEQLSAPRVIEERATRELHMVRPAGSEVMFIARVKTARPTKTIVADAR